MLIRICLIAVIVGALATVGFNIVLMNKKITAAVAERDRFHSERDQEVSAKRVAQKNAEDAQVSLQKTTIELAMARIERDRAVAGADVQARKVTALVENLSKTQAEQKEAHERLAAWDGVGISIEKARDMIGSLKDRKEELNATLLDNKVLFARMIRLAPRIGDIDIWPEGSLPDNLTGTVLACDPKFDFVVLDFGEKQGALENGKLLVTHKGKLVAEIKITDSIQPDRCIANVMPGWKLGEIMEGDQVFPR